MKNASVLLLSMAMMTACSSSTGTGDEGEGEPGEGEGEQNIDGEGEAGEGEGEGEVLGEGEGEEVGEGEGEGEGDTEQPLDCNAPLSFDVNRRSMPGVFAYHGIAFANDNNLVSYGGGNIEKTTRAGVSSLFVPSLATVEQLETMANGDILAVQSDQLLRVTSDGVATRIGGDLFGGYGVTIGPDGNAYVSANSGVFRVDLVTGEMEEVIASSQIASAHDVDFNLDSTIMYVGTINQGLWSVAVDEDLNPVGQPIRIGNGFDGWMDAVVVDECGYLWVPEFNAATLHRINPVTGEDNASVCGTRECYPHGVTFGADAAGWNHRAIYMPRPYAGGEAVEIEVGVRAGMYARTFRGVPQAVPPDGPREMGNEVCDNGIDDDGDVVADCDDTDCDGSPACDEICSNGIDDDGDFVRDCRDTDCNAECAEVCDNDIDDDQNSVTDCADGACANSPLCIEICDNNIDDDNDGLTDCAEASCYNPAICVEICANGTDDDQDFMVDCNDDICASDVACLPPVVTIDLGDRNSATAVTLPFSEGVGNESGGGEECIAFDVSAPSTLNARTQSPGCESTAFDHDTVLELYRGNQSIAFNDDSLGLCSALQESLEAGSYTLCVRTFGANAALLPVFLVASITLL